MYTVTSLT